ncbi:MAG: hypothetical protein N2596_06910 [Syntrophorhabdaceae bacterium]|nr:hypothetical protein [Syntrophorhabdaceae bacterium]
MLLNSKKEIIERWFEMIISFYPEDAKTFMLYEKDRFLNPIGTTILDAINIIYDFLFEGKDKNLATYALESIIKIMALEAVKMSHVTSIGLYLKNILQERYATEDQEVLNTVYERIDELSVTAVHMYMRCKEEINRIRLKEMYAWNFRMDMLKYRGAD